MSKENQDYHLVICSICKPNDFENNNFQGSMVITNGSYNFLSKSGYNKKLIGIFECLSRFDPVVYPNFDFKKHISELFNYKPGEQ